MVLPFRLQRTMLRTFEELPGCSVVQPGGAKVLEVAPACSHTPSSRPACEGDQACDVRAQCTRHAAAVHLTNVQAVSRAPPRTPPLTMCSMSLRLISGSSSGSSSSFAPSAMACKVEGYVSAWCLRTHACES